jgi:hypothetical protein
MISFVPLHLNLGYVLLLVVATIAPRFPMVLGDIIPRFHLYLFRERILPRKTNNTARNAKKLSICFCFSVTENPLAGKTCLLPTGIAAGLSWYYCTIGTYCVQLYFSWICGLLHMNYLLRDS